MQVSFREFSYLVSGGRTLWVRLAPAGRRESGPGRVAHNGARRAATALSRPTLDRAASSSLPVRVYTTIRVSDACSFSLWENFVRRRLMNSCKAARLIRVSELVDQYVFRAYATQNRIGVKPYCQARSQWSPNFRRRRQPARPAASPLSKVLYAAASPNNAPAICGRRPQSPFSCASSGPRRGGRTAPAPRDSAAA